eukprot:TRINITY_DN25132_c0_g1_i1.p1 TRINITY_DN25132_c0_g1~~TRINITY_DN25132_c0_g1_i1.p1  ORF type:complete len:132 (+),score=23.99 TRINITY_DN25132_c0_g1_i1:60-398(+)
MCIRDSRCTHIYQAFLIKASPKVTSFFFLNKNVFSTFPIGTSTSQYMKKPRTNEKIVIYMISRMSVKCDTQIFVLVLWISHIITMKNAKYTEMLILAKKSINLLPRKLWIAS